MYERGDHRCATWPGDAIRKSVVGTWNQKEPRKTADCRAAAQEPLNLTVINDSLLSRQILICPPVQNEWLSTLRSEARQVGVVICVSP